MCRRSRRWCWTPRRELAFQRSDIALYVSVQGLVFVALARLPAHRRVVAQAPVTQIEAGVEAHESRVIVTGAGAVPISVKVVTEHACRNPAVPQFRADIAPGITLQGRLGNAEVERLVLGRKVRAGALDQTAQCHAALTTERLTGLGWQLGHFHALALKQPMIHAHHRLAAVGLGLNADVLAAVQLAIEQNVGAVLSWRHRVTGLVFTEVKIA